MTRETRTAVADSVAFEQKLAAAWPPERWADVPTVVAVSGGADSVALLAALRRLAAPAAVGNLIVAHLNHRLRGDESEGDEAFVVAVAKRLGVRCETRRVDVAASAAARGVGLEEAAREARYEFFLDVARRYGARYVVTAHTLDDQAETVLLRVLRGSGSDGLAGIPERSPDGRVVRPLLAASRAQILDYATRVGLHWREDPSNRSAAYARSRLRTRWLPGLANDFNPGLLRALGRLAEAQRRDAEWMESLVEREAEKRFRSEAGAIWIEPGGWAELPEALALRLARRALRSAGIARDVSNIHLARVVQFLRDAAPGRAIELPGHVVLARERSGFRLGARGVLPGGAC